LFQTAFKKDSGREEFALIYLLELEKDRSEIVVRVYNYEEKNTAEESRRLTKQLVTDILLIKSEKIYIYLLFIEFEDRKKSFLKQFSDY
jgi:hypothetical protein